MNRIINFFIVLTFVISYGFLLVVTYWLFAPYQAAEYKNQTLPLVKTQLKQGDPIQVVHNYCKLLDAELHGVVEIEDSIILQLPNFTSNSKVGCYNRVNIPGTVPMVFPIGTKARVHYTLIYEVNPLRIVKYHLYTEHFTVVQ